MSDLEAGVPEGIEDRSNGVLVDRSVVQQQQVDVGIQAEFASSVPTYCHDRYIGSRSGQDREAFIERGREDCVDGSAESPGPVRQN
jgi:hypothetical protein